MEKRKEWVSGRETRVEVKNEWKTIFERKIGREDKWRITILRWKVIERKCLERKEWMSKIVQRMRFSENEPVSKNDWLNEWVGGTERICSPYISHNNAIVYSINALEKFICVTFDGAEFVSRRTENWFLSSMETSVMDSQQNHLDENLSSVHVFLLASIIEKDG